MFKFENTENHKSIAPTCSDPQVIPNCVPFYTGLELNLKEHVHVKRKSKSLNISSSTHLSHSLRAPMLHSCKNIHWPPPFHFFTTSTHNLTLLKSFIHNTKRL